MTKAEDVTNKVDALIGEVRKLEPLTLPQAFVGIFVVCTLCLGAYEISGILSHYGWLK